MQHISKHTKCHSSSLRQNFPRHIGRPKDGLNSKAYAVYNGKSESNILHWESHCRKNIIFKELKVNT